MNEARYREAEDRLWASTGVTPRDRRVRLERLGVSVRVQEVGEGHPVVCVHGGSNAGSSWARLAGRLSGFRCLLLDRPGCGLSEPLAGRLDAEGMQQVARTQLVDLLDALELSSAQVIATSYGGLSALLSAAAHPDRIDRSVLLGWPVGAPIAHVPMVMRIAAIRPLGYVMAALPPTERSVRSMLRQVGLRRAIDTGRFSPEELAWFHALLRDTDTMGNEVRSNRYLSLRHGLFGGLIIPDEVLASIRNPLLLLWGEDDPFGGAPIARQLATRIPGARLELVAEAGHAVWVDELDHTAAAIARFLGSPEVGESSPRQAPDAAAVRLGTRGATADRDARIGQSSGEAC
jgi:2-hydroxy-6-oxonona-2,4-dienedioate hydrolase